ncbi:MAG: UdgX family uracil-DNA binding protein [Janthinobacterium lividum]
MHKVTLPPDFDAWRDAARGALRQGYTPEQVDLEDATHPSALDLLMLEEAPAGTPAPQPHVPKAFLEAAKIVAVHRDPQRWNLLYRLLYRLQSNRDLLRVEVDQDVAQLKSMEAQIRRDLHKMHAFVRFRKVDEPGPDGSVQEHFIAWYRPDHRILHLAAPFFAERFAPMRWTILTPDESTSWDPQAKQLTFSAGTGKEAAPQEDELETLWRSYYGSIFNPARLNPETMRSEMPVRYWQHLPEVTLLPELMQRAERRVSDMVIRQSKQPTAAPFVPAEHTIPILQAALPSCEGCDLYKHATQVVPGVGHLAAALMLVGEQPGDQEDRQGAPFVGPAGGVLRKALDEIGISAEEIYLTNAVKHFKFVQRGRIRLHQNPRMSEITACKPWLSAEIDAVKPRVILCLGASAAKSLLGGTFALMRERGVIKQTPFAERVIATVHPSAVLRAQDEQGRAQLYNFLRDDLAFAYLTAKQAA